MESELPVDADPHDRPGVPREKSPPQAVASEPVPAAGRPGEVLMEPTRAHVTPVYGTARPLRGLAGMLRRAAYRVPDYRTRRWALLLLADRVEAKEVRVRRILRDRAAWLVAGALGGGLGLVVRRRRS